MKKLSSEKQNFQSRIKAFGRYEKQENQSLKLVEENDIIELTPNSIVGYTYEVTGDKNQQLKIINQYSYPNGKSVEAEGVIDTNSLFASILNYPNANENFLGKTIFRTLFPENSEIAPLEKTFYLYDGTKGTLFVNKPFNPATDKDILAFENTYQVTLCDDYKQFLKEYNGLYLFWWFDSDKINAQKGAYQSDKYGFTQTHYPFYEDLGTKQEDWDWIYEAKHLFGLGNKNPYHDMNDFHMPNLFYHNDLVKYAYPIGQDGGGNCIMQIAQGKHRGKLAMLDHEVSSSMIDWVKGETEDVYNIPPSEATADGFLEDCFEYGGLTLYDISLKEYVAELIQKHRLLYDDMLKKYGV